MILIQDRVGDKGQCTTELDTIGKKFMDIVDISKLLDDLEMRGDCR